jgi:hypothetical protein
MHGIFELVSPNCTSESLLLEFLGFGWLLYLRLRIVIVTSTRRKALTIALVTKDRVKTIAIFCLKMQQKRWGQVDKELR